MAPAQRLHVCVWSATHVAPMSYVVCENCRYVYEPINDGICPSCGHKHSIQPMFGQRIEAEAYAVGLWLKEGYSITDVCDPYFQPKR